MSDTDHLFAKNAIEAVAELEESLLLTESHLHLQRCGGCGGPAYQQPCAICNYYPMGSDKGYYSPKLATFDHFNAGVERSGPGGKGGNFATWYFRTSWSRITVLKHRVEAAVEEAAKLAMPSTRVFWDTVVVDQLNVQRDPAPKHIYHAWSGMFELRRLLEDENILPHKYQEFRGALTSWVAAVHASEPSAITESIERGRDIMRTHARLFPSGNASSALRAFNDALEHMPQASLSL